MASASENNIDAVRNGEDWIPVTRLPENSERFEELNAYDSALVISGYGGSGPSSKEEQYPTRYDVMIEENDDGDGATTVTGQVLPLRTVEIFDPAVKLEALQPSAFPNKVHAGPDLIRELPLIWHQPKTSNPEQTEDDFSDDKCHIRQSNTLPSIIESIISSITTGPSVDWQSFRLSPRKFCLLEQELKARSLWEFFDEKIRYSYFPTTCSLELKMPSYLHEICVEKLTKVVEHALHELSSRVGSTAGQGKKYDPSSIQNWGSPSVKGEDTLCADKLFCIEGGIFAIEVALSQPYKSLREKAWRWINSGIRAIITLDIKGQKIAYRVWTAQKCQNDYNAMFLEETVSEICRNKDGTVIDGGDLSVPFSSLIPWHILDDMVSLEGERLSISCEQLVQIVNEAQKQSDGVRSPPTKSTLSPLTPLLKSEGQRGGNKN